VGAAKSDMGNGAGEVAKVRPLHGRIFARALPGVLRGPTSAFLPNLVCFLR
jgi:hypothetical protein